MRPARKSVDAGALVHNYRYLKSRSPRTRVLAVVKADAYGHGLLRAARALSAGAEVDGFAVAVVAEGLALRAAATAQPGGRAGDETAGQLAGRLVLVMQGAAGRDELRAAAAHDLTLVVHSHEQLAALEQHGAEGLALWVKFDTGMNRLGFPAATAAAVLARIKRLRDLSRAPVLMSHFAHAGEPAAAAQDEAQWRRFERIRAGAGLAASIANSAGALCRPDSLLDWARVGIALYGAPPACAAAEHHRRLKPVMRVVAPVIAVRRCKAGDGIGYGGAYVCPRDMRVAIVGIGYGDGYPRHARNATPVWLAGGPRELVGRVSMDLIAVALGDAAVAVGDTAELWGPQLPVAEVAMHCGTLSYELLCAARGIKEQVR